MDLLKVTMKQVPMGKPGTVGNVANLTDAKRTVPGHRSRREALVAGMLAPGGVCGDGTLYCVLIDFFLDFICGLEGIWGRDTCCSMCA